MILTSRLVLRGWEARDREPYHAIKRDPVVMATLGPPQTRAECDAMIDRLIVSEAQHGYTFWALERRLDGLLLGYAGLLQGPEHTPIAGELEVGWGLGSAHWGQGYAREAAAAVLAWAWANTRVGQVVAITTPGNVRSWRLMERLGMRRDPAGDFLHPRLADGDPLRPHITYRIVRPG